MQNTVPFPPPCAVLCMCCSLLQRAELCNSPLRSSKAHPPTRTLLDTCMHAHSFSYARAANGGLGPQLGLVPRVPGITGSLGPAHPEVVARRRPRLNKHFVEEPRSPTAQLRFGRSGRLDRSPRRIYAPVQHMN
jgi:hypothetical protein